MQTIRERLLSNENIYLSIYLAHSYVQNKELLRDEDLKLLNEITDVFCLDTISTTTKKVKERIEQVLLKPDEFFDVIVYLKPKKYENGKTSFRPLHTAELIDQIAMIAMLQVLVYDIEPKTNKLLPSELSRLIPSDFYGNRISYNGTELFKPWQEQYHEYTSTANEMVSSFCQTLEYKYEVSLDLTNFFPTINPQIVYNHITSHLPLRLSNEDLSTLKTILRKLLIFRLCPLEKSELAWYLRTDTKEITDHHKYVYAKGLPQGLPHTYFLANLFMLVIKEQYFSVFPGEMLFYVDDSVIFTNGITGAISEKSFETSIADLNVRISLAEDQLLKKSTDCIFPADYCYNTVDFGVTVHDANSKSVFASIEDVQKNSGELYLRSLSRETSNIGFDMFSTFSDSELSMLLSRTSTIIEALNKEVSRVKSFDITKKVYRDKLLRYKKYFSYRYTILNHRCTGNIDQLKSEVIAAISRRRTDFRIESFFELYSDDILASTIAFCLKKCTEGGIDCSDLISEIQDLDNYLFDNCTNHSYFRMAYLEYIKKQLKHFPIDKYATLEKQAHRKFISMRLLSYKTRLEKFNDTIIKPYASAKDRSLTLFNFVDMSAIFEYSKYVRCNSNELDRMIWNAIYSFIFEYNISDSFVMSKVSHLPMQYSELRVLAMLRNRDFNLNEFEQMYALCSQEEYIQTADYSLLQVLEIFYLFVHTPQRIDELIRIHKYCCDTWKNGSKHLHFYTLHNQEHAVSLIRSSIELLHAISYFELKQIDFFVLFAACYLHDISMVSLPDPNIFVIGDNEQANYIYSNFTEKYDIEDCVKSKKALCDAYYAIDGFFEQNVRSNHACNSAKEIRTFKELDFIEATTREFIAKVSHAHGCDSTDIYYGKSSGSTTLVNEKFIKILLRLSDLLDMSRYRISRVILDHNLKSINPVSRFHWISHLITDGFDLDSQYEYVESNNSNDSCIRKGGITEKVVLTVNVLMSQTTEVENSNHCKYVESCTFKNTEKEGIHISLACSKDNLCNSEKCNFLCKWFVLKNNYLMEEFAILRDYLNSITDNFYTSAFEVRVRVISNTDIPNDIFDHLREYVNGHSI